VRSQWRLRNTRRKATRIINVHEGRWIKDEGELKQVIEYTIGRNSSRSNIRGFVQSSLFGFRSFAVLRLNGDYVIVLEL
jgi:hypothetical protein